mmetsp:Transcript_116528/g.189776  ORF Transcript_116528/g.189776 Transcript_116528/m.189776 type:complete len:88 (+) Transcript_116528:397-660(+)
MILALEVLAPDHPKLGCNVHWCETSLCTFSRLLPSLEIDNRVYVLSFYHVLDEVLVFVLRLPLTLSMKIMPAANARLTFSIEEEYCC